MVFHTQPSSERSERPSASRPEHCSRAEIDDDSLGLVAAMVPLMEHGTLANCARVSSAWRRAFDPLIRTLIGRIGASIRERQSDDLLRRSTLWRERRRALRASLDDPELLLELMAHLRGNYGESLLSNDAQQQLQIAVRVTAALASTILNAGSEAEAAALEQAPVQLRTHTFWVIDARDGWAGAEPIELFLWEALRHADDQLAGKGAPVPWIRLARCGAWRAVLELASAQPWFVQHGLSAELAHAVPELNALVRWSLAAMDEVGFMAAEKDARAADAHLREMTRVLQLLRRRRRGAGTGARQD